MQHKNSQLMFKEILKGNICQAISDPPSRTIKLFVASSKQDFRCERSRLHEYIFPELQRHCALAGLDLLVVDSNWQYYSIEEINNKLIEQTASQNCSISFSHQVNPSKSSTKCKTSSIQAICSSSNQSELDFQLQHKELVLNCARCFVDPIQFALELNEIQHCYNRSINVFFLGLVGQKYKPFVLPSILHENEFIELKNFQTNCKHIEQQSNLLDKYYLRDENNLTGSVYRLIDLSKYTNQLSSILQWKSSKSQPTLQSAKLLNQSTILNLDLIHFCIEIKYLIQLMQEATCASLANEKQILNLPSFLHTQIKHAININQFQNDRILVCVRRLQDFDMEGFLTYEEAGSYDNLFDNLICNYSKLGYEQMLHDLICNTRKRTIHFFSLPLDVIKIENLKQGSNENETNVKCLKLNLTTDYLYNFTNNVFNSLREIIEQAAIKNRAYFDNTNDLIFELHSHLANCRQQIYLIQANQQTRVLFDFESVHQVQRLMLAMEQYPGQTLTTAKLGISSNFARRSPIVITGCEGTGKSTVLSQVYFNCTQWFGEDTEVIRIYRQIGTSPSSCYSSELLRSLCLHISMLFTADLASFPLVIDHELNALVSWFNELLKIVETTCTNQVLIIILDDLHRVRSLKSNSVLSWFPFSLPFNVHLIFSVDQHEHSLLDILHTRITGDNFVNLNPTLKEWSTIENILNNKLLEHKRKLTEPQWTNLEQKFNFLPDESQINLQYLDLLVENELQYWPSFEPNLDFNLISIDQMLNINLLKLERAFGGKILAKICTYIAYTRYGLREIEIQELITSEDLLQFNQVHVWLNIKQCLNAFLKEKYILGRLYLHWKHASYCVKIQSRYVKNDLTRRRIHSELANSFYLGLTEILQQENSVTLQCNNKQPCADILREMDELWYHLVMAGDLQEIKTYTLLNIDFLMSCIQNSSISYLRSVLELVRGLFFDWELELLINMLKNCISIVSQAPVQFIIEILIWLKQFSSIGPINLNKIKDVKKSPKQLAKQARYLELDTSLGGNQSVSSSSTIPTSSSLPKKVSNHQDLKYKTNKTGPNPLLDNLIESALTWCVHNCSQPLLIPLNNWLNLNLPSQVIAIHLNQTAISNAVLSGNKQYLIFTQTKHLHIFHLPTKKQIRIIEGRYLATGCEDSIVNIYEAIQHDQLNFKLNYKLNSQSKGIMCCTFTFSEELVLTGSESGLICVHFVENGHLITKLNLHQSMVTCICVNANDDVFVSCSTDGTININSLKDFDLLNQININRPILHMDVSLNSTFLMISCDDNCISIYALTTGSKIHCLETPTSTQNNVCVVTQIRFSNDSCRAIVGTGDGCIFIYDVHTAKLLQCQTSHSDMIVAIITYPFDNFLLTCGKSKAILWNFVVKKTICLDPIISKALSSSSALIPMITSASNIGINLHSISSSTLTNMPTQTSSSIHASSTSNTTMIAGSISANMYNQSSNSNLMISSSNGKTYLKSKRLLHKIDNHRDIINCTQVSKCGNYLITGGKDCLVKVWYLYTGETYYSFEGHLKSITCVAFASNFLFCVSGSDDKTIRLWPLNNAITSFIPIFTHHQHRIEEVCISNNSKRILSVDTQGVFRYWAVETGAQLMIISKTNINLVKMISYMVFYITGKNNNSVRFWSVYDSDNEKCVSHTESITCYTVTFDCEILITGSVDCSLKVWEVSSGKLTQVLVGHQQQITCVALAPFSCNKILSGSADCTAIVWDMNTGEEIFNLKGHRAAISQCSMSLDGSVAISCAEDNRLIVWNISEQGCSGGQQLVITDFHLSINQLKATHNLNHIIILPNNSFTFALFQFCRNPAQQKSLDELTPICKTKTEVDHFTRQLSSLGQFGACLNKTRHHMKREQSLDSIYWDHHLHRGLSVDDFTRLPAIHGLLSPHDSKDSLLHFSQTNQLHSSNTILMPNSQVVNSDKLGQMMNNSINLAKPSSLVSKLITGGKQKLLKKQQSMFACFPEHSISSTVLNSIGKSPLASPSLSSKLVSAAVNLQNNSSNLSINSLNLNTNNFQNLTTTLNKEFGSNKNLFKVGAKILTNQTSHSRSLEEDADLKSINSTNQATSSTTNKQHSLENQIMNSTICLIF